jgi:glucokinase
MARTIGVAMTDRLVVGVVEDNQVSGPVRRFPESEDTFISLQGMPADEIKDHIREEVEIAIGDSEVEAIGLGMPGIIHCGVVEDSPNLQQLKGYPMEQALAAGLRQHKIDVPLCVCNDADGMAAGLAATRGQLDRTIRVWTLGNGIGFGRYPMTEGVWEGGHTVVSLDPKETFCGCGGIGHLEGIMGHRAMRLRFLDMEPEEVFEAAKSGNQKCADFVKRWHRALAAGTSSSIHMAGPGRIYITGPSAHFVDVELLQIYTQEMVKMSPLQGYAYEVVPGGEDIAIIGAAVNAQRGTAN